MSKRATEQQHLQHLLESFDTAMLISRKDDQLHARPMAIAAVEGPSTIWFVTSTLSVKAQEIREDEHVSLTFQSARRFVALSGRARLLVDRSKIEELYKPDWKIWFPEGKDDPTIALIRVSVEDAEYWDNAGTRGVRYAFEAVKALVSGDTPGPVAGQHGRIKESGAAATSARRH